MDSDHTPIVRTPAGYSRMIFQQAKQCKEDLLAQGYGLEDVYLAMVHALARVAYAEGGEARLQEVGGLMSACLSKDWIGGLE